MILLHYEIVNGILVIKWVVQLLNSQKKSSKSRLVKCILTLYLVDINYLIQYLSQRIDMVPCT